MEELAIIQQSLVCPKTHYNAFAKYNYRNASDILDAFKNAAKGLGCSIVITDDIVVIGDKYFVKAVATITNKKGEQMSSSAFAELPNDRKGMDASQVTGASSSYARKYALNGLLAIDDTLDNDDIAAQQTPKPAKEKKSAASARKKILIDDESSIMKCVEYCSYNGVDASSLLKWYDIDNEVMSIINDKIKEFKGE